MNLIIDAAEKAGERYRHVRYVFYEPIVFYLFYEKNLEKWGHWEAIKKMISNGDVKLFGIIPYLSKIEKKPFPVIQRILPKSIEFLFYEDMKTKKFKIGDFESYRRLNFFPLDKILSPEFIHLINSECEFMRNPQKYEFDETAPPITLQNLLIDSNSHEYLLDKIKTLPKRRQSAAVEKKKRIVEACHQAAKRGNTRTVANFDKNVKNLLQEHPDFKNIGKISDSVRSKVTKKYWDNTILPSKAKLNKFKSNLRAS